MSKPCAVGVKTASGKRDARKSPVAGRSCCSTPGASTSASRRAAAILEVLAGMRTATEAAALLGISVNHYYLLERKALQGLAAACEPRPQGARGPSPQRQAAALERELQRCRRECMRQAALVRATQRAVGLPAVAPGKTPAKGAPGGGKRSRRRRATVRALRAAGNLRKNSSGPNPGAGVEPCLAQRAEEEESPAVVQARRMEEEPCHGEEGKEAPGGRPC